MKKPYVLPDLCLYAANCADLLTTSNDFLDDRADGNRSADDIFG